jgi:nitrite reductase (NADH) small subunit
VWVAGRPIALFWDGDTLRAVDNACRHVGSPLDDGLVEHGCLTCPWHGWRYELSSGDLLTELGPARGLRTYVVAVDRGRVLIGVPQ